MSLDRSILTFLKLPSAQKLLALQAAVALPVFWIAVRLASFGRLQEFLHSREGKFSDSPLTETEIIAIIRAVARWLPWTNSCLVVSSTACYFLRGRGMPVRIKVGVSNECGFKAHCWLESFSGEVLIEDPKYVSSFKPLT